MIKIDELKLAKSKDLNKDFNYVLSHSSISNKLEYKEQTNFFNQEALTTTIPAQFVKKFNCKIEKLTNFLEIRL